MLKLGRKLFSPSYISQKIFENLIGIPERQELFAGLVLTMIILLKIVLTMFIFPKIVLTMIILLKIVLTMIDYLTKESTYH